MKPCIFACLFVVVLAHHHHHSENHEHHGQPNPAGHTGCNQLQNAHICLDGCLADQVGYCFQDACYCKSNLIVRQALQKACTSRADCSTINCSHIHGAGHNHGGYCNPSGHCTCHHASSCKTSTDCIGFCVGKNANGTSTCHQFHGHGHCTHCDQH